MSTQTLDTTDLNSSATRRSGESPRQQSVCIEIPVSVHGSRSASGSLNNNQAAKPFLEETRTMIVFPSGAVLRLTESVSEGQILILKNPRVKQEVACRVVSSKTNASAKGYVEVEFFQAAPGFWGITFPSAPSAAPEPAPIPPQPRQTRVEPSASKPAFFQPPAPRPAAPAAPVISKPAPAPAPAIPAAHLPEPPATEPSISESPVSESFVPEPPAPTPAATARFVAAPIESKPFVAAPIVSSPITPLTPDSTQELNAAIAAAYRTPPEPPKPVKKIEPVHDVMPVKDFATGSASPASSIADVAPPPNKTLNPTRPKFVPPAKPARESFTSSEPLAMAESIGYPSSEFSAYSKSEKSAKQSRSSSANSSSIEARKVELTSSQIASEAVLGKPMFGANTEVSAAEKSGSSKGWLIAAAVVILLGGGAGAYWWTTTHKLGATNSVSAAPPATTTAAVPAGAAQPGATPSATTSQPSNNPVSAQTSAAAQKPGVTPHTAPVNPLAVKPDAPSAVVNSHRPTILPSEKIAAPVSHSNNSSIASEPAPDVIGKTSPTTGASLSAILPSMGQPSSAPAPPPAKPSGPPLPASTLQQPKLIKSEAAVYPKIAATRGDWGDVMVDATVGESGQVTDAKVISGPETLRQSALQVVRTQTYQPARLNGKPVSMHVMVKVPFPKPR
jgi:TonB family protein